MSFGYAKRRVDKNLAETVGAFRKLGCSVWIVNAEVDLVAGWGGLSILCEVKNGALAPSRRKLTTAQVKFRETWTGGVRLVQNLNDVENTVRCLKSWHAAICQINHGAVSG